MQSPLTPPTSMERDLWIECQLLRSFLANAKSSIAGLSIAAFICIYVLWGLVPSLPLGIWSIAMAFNILHRFWISKTLVQMDWKQQPLDFLQTFKRHSALLPFSALLWASLLFLYFEKVPTEIQFVCMMVLVGLGSFSVVTMAARYQVFTRYLNCLWGTTLLFFLQNAFFDSNKVTQTNHIALIVLVILYWLLSHRTGKRLNTIMRAGFGLQYDNAHLIDSLRHQTQTALKATEVKGRLLASAAHDLRQPIHALAFYADLLRTEPKDSGNIVPKILTATDSVNDLFNSLFDFAKLESGDIQAHSRSVPVCSIMNPLLVQFEPAAVAKNLVLRDRIAPAYVLTDPVLMQRIVGNLLANAIRYSNEGGVMLSTRVRGGVLWIEVWDTGPGIAEQYLPYIFQEFYKIPALGSEQGFGLGLAIVQRLCGVLGHSLTVQSRLGHGTRFRLEVALATPPK